MHINVPAVDAQKLIGKTKGKGEKSRTIQKRVQEARDMQLKRFNKKQLTSNSEMNTKEVKRYCKLRENSKTMMISATASMNLTARSYFKVIKVARTIADIEKEKDITTNHLAEALQYRPKEEDI